MLDKAKQNMAFLTRLSLFLTVIATTLVCGVSQGQAQERVATMQMTNSTNATLVMEFVRDADRRDFRVVQLEPGEYRAVHVPAGIVTLTIRAPHSDADFRFSETEALNTGSTYELVFTPQAFGLAQLSNDRLNSGQGGTDNETAEIYNACIDSDENTAVWFMYNPINTLSRSIYFQSGNYLCHEEGTGAYGTGAVLRYYDCDASFRNCEREEIWDANLSAEEPGANEYYNGVVRTVARRDVIFLNPDLASWRVIIYR